MVVRGGGERRERVGGEGGGYIGMLFNCSLVLTCRV